MNESHGGGKIAAVVATFLYAVGAGVLMVMALQAVVAVAYPQSSVAPWQGSFPPRTEEKCLHVGGTWQGSDGFDGYCSTPEEQERQRQAERFNFISRVSSVAVGALALVVAFSLAGAGLLVRFGLATGGVMLLLGVSGINLFFVTIPGAFGGGGGCLGCAFPALSGTLAIGEAVIFVGAWLAVLFAGYNYGRTSSKHTSTSE